jgi:hypothetical protein
LIKQHGQEQHECLPRLGEAMKAERTRRRDGA